MADSDNQETINVFVIEDHETMREMVCRLIRHAPGLSLCGRSESAEEALAQFPHCHPQIVLVDLSLPGMDGLALIEHLHQNQPEILTLAISAYPESVYAMKCLEAGAHGYLTKDKLISVVEAIHHIHNGGLYISEHVRSEINQ